MCVITPSFWCRCAIHETNPKQRYCKRLERNNQEYATHTHIRSHMYQKLKSSLRLRSSNRYHCSINKILNRIIMYSQFVMDGLELSQVGACLYSSPSLYHPPSPSRDHHFQFNSSPLILQHFLLFFFFYYCSLRFSFSAFSKVFLSNF